MMAVQEYTEFDELIKFIKSYIYYLDETRIDIIKKHIEYGTFDCEKDEKGFRYAVRWNISQSGTICDVLDMCVREDLRRRDLLRYVIAKNWTKFPYMKFLRFSRALKYKQKDPKI